MKTISGGDFTSIADYQVFANSVVRKRRYMFEPQARQFLSAVEATLANRIHIVKSGSILFRAQLGSDSEEVTLLNIDPKDQKIERPVPYPKKRMTPLKRSAREGRVNAKGIPCLYLSDDRNTAMAEVRPWVGAYVSLGEFRTSHELRLVDCCEPRHMPMALSPDLSNLPKPRTTQELRDAVWGEISHAFAEPVTNTDSLAEYIPTQILSDLFRDKRYDGIQYKSELGSGHNFALFDLDAANLLSCGLYTVLSVGYKFNLWDEGYRV